MRTGLIFLMGTIVSLSLFFQEGAVFSQESQQFSIPEIFQYPPVRGRDPFSSLIKPEEKPQEKLAEKPQEKLAEKPQEKLAEKPQEESLPVITTSAYKVVGIVWGEGEDIALIMKEDDIWMVKEGEVVDGLKVARIEGEKGEVVLVGEDKIIKLNMLGV